MASLNPSNWIKQLVSSKQVEDTTTKKEIEASKEEVEPKVCKKEAESKEEPIINKREVCPKCGLPIVTEHTDILRAEDNYCVCDDEVEASKKKESSQKKKAIKKAIEVKDLGDDKVYQDPKDMLHYLDSSAEEAMWVYEEEGKKSMDTTSDLIGEALQIGDEVYTVEASQKREATGEWDEGDEQLVSWKNEVEKAIKEIEKLTEGKLKFESIKGFDKYQGPVATVSIDGQTYKVWDAQEAGEEILWIEDYEIENTAGPDSRPGLQGDVNFIAEVINKEYIPGQQELPGVDAPQKAEKSPGIGKAEDSGMDSDASKTRDKKESSKKEAQEELLPQGFTEVEKKEFIGDPDEGRFDASYQAEQYAKDQGYKVGPSSTYDAGDYSHISVVGDSDVAYIAKMHNIDAEDYPRIKGFIFSRSNSPEDNKALLVLVTYSPSKESSKKKSQIDKFREKVSEQDKESQTPNQPKPQTPPAPGYKWAYQSETDNWIQVPTETETSDILTSKKSQIDKFREKVSKESSKKEANDDIAKVKKLTQNLNNIMEDMNDIVKDLENKTYKDDEQKADYMAELRFAYADEMREVADELKGLVTEEESKVKESSQKKEAIETTIEWYVPYSHAFQGAGSQAEYDVKKIKEIIKSLGGTNIHTEMDMSVKGDSPDKAEVVVFTSEIDPEVQSEMDDALQEALGSEGIFVKEKTWNDKTKQSSQKKDAQETYTEGETVILSRDPNEPVEATVLKVISPDVVELEYIAPESGVVRSDRYYTSQIQKKEADLDITKVKTPEEINKWVKDNLYDEDNEKRYINFIKELEKISKKYGVVLKVTGGVTIYDAPLSEVSYTADSTSGDILPKDILPTKPTE